MVRKHKPHGVVRGEDAKGRTHGTPFRQHTFLISLTFAWLARIDAEMGFNAGSAVQKKADRTDATACVVGRNDAVTKRQPRGSMLSITARLR